MSRSPCPSDVSDAEWAFLAPHLTLMREDALQRVHPLRELLNGLRYALRAGGAWRMMPNDLPPWHTIHRQAQRWIARGCFEAAVHDLREILRLKEVRHAPPTTAILDERVLRSTPESGHRAGYSGAKRTKGSKAHLAVDTLGCLLALFVTPASVDEEGAADLARRVQEATGESVELAYVDQGHTAPDPAAAASEHGIAPEVVRLDEAKKGFVLLPRRWVAERSFAWSSRFKRLAKDYERLPETLAGLHVLAFCTLVLGALAPWLQGA